MKLGDKLTKTKRFSNFLYCKYGGLETEVPIGTIGEIVKIVRNNRIEVNFKNGHRILKIIKNNKIKVKFENGRTWFLDKSEFTLI